ncbi:hypothetical protein [Acidithiobacillus thiooxidans]|uniref:hypothetical protein n=1 Tax=Acidithiobacillus thiooxidans TaxID=930 RepID=UPI0004E20FCD|nr:hypothetical protein [Acidithiobacillus thiooxidans]
MSRLKTAKASAMAAPAVLAIRKPLRQRLDTLCAERSCSLDTLAADAETMREVFAYVWDQFPAYIKVQVTQDLFVQYCMQERYRLVDEVSSDSTKPKKPTMLQKLRERKRLKQEASA